MQRFPERWIIVLRAVYPVGNFSRNSIRAQNRMSGPQGRVTGDVTLSGNCKFSSYSLYLYEYKKSAPRKSVICLAQLFKCDLVRTIVPLNHISDDVKFPAL